MATTVTAPPFARNFPASTAKPSKYFKWPGVTWESTEAVRRTLEENNRGYDIYESRRFAHNHFPHSVLTRYAFGAPPKLVDDTWALDKTHLVSLDPSAPDRKDVDASKLPKSIDRSNWGKYLGVKGCYSQYLVFFHAEIDRLGPTATLEEYVFSSQANYEVFVDGEGKERGIPGMLNRLVAGVLHPFIHIGFGLEFDDRVVLAEGLAEAAVHQDEIVKQLVTPDHLRHIMSSPASTTEARPTLLQLYARLVASPDLTPPPYNESMMITDKLKKSLDGSRGEALRALVDEWILTDEDLENGWDKKMEEIAVFVTLLACGTGREGHPARVDFFLMHALTSSIFLPAYLPLLPLISRRALLRAYALTVFHTSISRGRPQLNPGLLMSYDAFPVSPHSDGSLKAMVKEGKALGKGEVEGRNAWTSLVETALIFPDSHVVKSIRSLVHYATLYSNTAPGSHSASTNDGTIDGMEKVDGSIFLRAAGAVMATMAKSEGGEADWDRSSLGYDEAWEQ
ncbi:hypothetical protein IAT38_004567 [Cryptococcus sp. DSM 104549]